MFKILINQKSINYLNLNKFNNQYYLNLLNYSKNHHDFTKRNSYTHKQDARATKRREGVRDSEEMGGQLVGPGDIVTETENPTISKPNHKRSKPITHKKKLEQLDHHHQKKLERSEKDDKKEKQRLELIEELEKEKEADSKKSMILDDDHGEDKVNENNYRRSKKNVKKSTTTTTSGVRRKGYAGGVASAGTFTSEGTTEYSEFKSNQSDIDSDATNITFENDLSILDRKSRPSRIHQASDVTFDISKIDPSKIIQLEDLSFDEDDEYIDEDDESNSQQDEPYTLSMKEAREKFKFDDKDIDTILEQFEIDEKLGTMFSGGSKQQSKQQQQQQQQQQKEITNNNQLKNNNINNNNNNNQSSNELLKEFFEKKYGNVKVNNNPITIQEVTEFMSNSHLDDFFVVDVSNKCHWTKYMIVASSDSTRLLQNTKDELIAHFKNRLDVESDPSNTDDWVVVNLNDIVIHLFETKKREYYDLETLWATRRHISYGKEESWDDEQTSKLEEDD